MADAKHTPGPWMANGLYADIEIRGPGGVLVAVVNSVHAVTSSSGSRQRADARLIKAAPELLESLRNASHLLASCALIVDDAQSRARLMDTTKAARALIAKATGSDA